MAEISKPKSPKEIDVFNRFSNRNKLKTALITLLIAVVSFTIFYFFVKSLLTYRISYTPYGGTVFGEEVQTSEYKFLQKTKAPDNLKKEGYYIEGYYKDSEFTNKYTFGRPIWRSAHLHVNWKPGFAVQLFFAEGEEEKSSMTEEYLKLYHEQYVEPGSEYTLHPVYNDIQSDKDHYGEQLLFYLNPECTGDPVEIYTFTVTENIKIYGKWFDTAENKFTITEDGVLTRYLGNCDNIKLPSTVTKIKDVDTDKFNGGVWNPSNTADGTVFSAFDKVLKDLEVIYLNAELTELGECSFRNCGSLKGVYFLGNNVTKIGRNAFAFCVSLESIHIPDSVTTIESRAFYQVGKKSSTITGGDYVETIGDLAFAECKVKSLEFKRATYVGQRAFSNCLNLESLTLGATVVVETNVTNISGDMNTDNNVLFESDKAVLYVPENLVEEYKTSYPWSFYSSRIKSIS